MLALMDVAEDRPIEPLFPADMCISLLPHGYSAISFGQRNPWDASWNAAQAVLCGKHASAGIASYAPRIISRTRLASAPLGSSPHLRAVKFHLGISTQGTVFHRGSIICQKYTAVISNSIRLGSAW